MAIFLIKPKTVDTHISYIKVADTDIQFAAIDISVSAKYIG